MKYKSMRIPDEFYEDIKKKKENLQRDYKKITGIDVDIPMTNILIELGKKEVFYIKDVDNLTKRRWKKL
jgi:hypothetical protein